MQVIDSCFERKSPFSNVSGRKYQAFDTKCNNAFQQPYVKGKFLYVGNSKLWIRGVTYGTFRPDENGIDYPRCEIVERDFSQISANGFNAIRTYTMPPRWLLDAARRRGLYVMVGLPWEQHVDFLQDNKRARDIERRLCGQVRACAGHPAILAYAIGNEIPASIVRWLGHRRVERFLSRLYRAVKAEAPDTLITYVNYPTTEYLQLPFLDFVTFNVYLESPERLEAYLARLQNIAGDRPLIMSEIGVDSLRNGEENQARVLEWQLKAVFAPGCAGAFIFSWTDEWYRGGADIEDWAFGITDRDRRSKPALVTVRETFSRMPFDNKLSWSKISVIVCTFNGSRTLAGCLDGLLKLDYPNFEVIVVNDGSTDSTAKIAEDSGFRVISTENHGLSSARNTGLRAATAEIVAYIDDDAYPDRDWLRYLASTFMNTDHVGVGGPNLSPPDDGPVAECIAHSPGNPVHILLSDTEAEHIPGCNMAFRKSALEAIGGFDTDLRIAGDDVDVCWRFQQLGWTLGYNPGAMVWHHRRNSLRAYWKQQHNYGKAEAILERKWPEKYNLMGHLTWVGRVYTNGHQYKTWSRGRIYHGVWGSAPFQSIYQSPAGALESWLSMPEWYLAVAALAPLSVLGFAWSPLFYALPLLLLALAAPICQAILSASRVCFPGTNRSRYTRFKLHCLTAFSHLIQPVARLTGRLRSGLTFWRYHSSEFSFPWPRTRAIWSEKWEDSSEKLETLKSTLQTAGAYVRPGGDFDKWDLQVQAGLFGSARVLMGVEEHGSGKQFARYCVWPRCSFAVFPIASLIAALSSGAGVDSAWGAFTLLGALAALMLARSFYECGSAVATVLDALHTIERNGAARVEIETRPDFAVTSEDFQPRSVGVSERAQIQTSEMSNLQQPLKLGRRFRACHRTFDRTSPT